MLMGLEQGPWMEKVVGQNVQTGTVRHGEATRTSP
jgi:hypothetical protein